MIYKKYIIEIYEYGPETVEFPQCNPRVAKCWGVKWASAACRVENTDMVSQFNALPRTAISNTPS